MGGFEISGNSWKFTNTQNSEMRSGWHDNGWVLVEDDGGCANFRFTDPELDYRGL